MRFLPPLLFLTAASLAGAVDVYQKPPKEVLDVLNAPATPRAFVSPAHTNVLLCEPLRYPAIADLSQPMLRLAGCASIREPMGRTAQLYTGMMLKRSRRRVGGAHRGGTQRQAERAALEPRRQAFRFHQHSRDCASSCGWAMQPPAKSTASKACASMA